MRKTYLFLFALILSVMGATSAMGQKIYRAELDKSMFKAWDGWGAGANEVAEPEAIDDGVTFDCESNLYKSLGAGQMVYGNTNVYYLWYADITGTQQLIINATPGMQFRVLINRPEPVEGGDAHGGTTVELNPTANDAGEAIVDLSSYEYVHLNAIKTGWGSPSGVVNSIEIVGTVKPVTGILSLINNGDAEGTDLSSFPVSWDGPNNGDSANDKPEIVGGGVNGSNCFKVVPFDNPTETWHTQFYIKADEVMPRGSLWKLTMSIKADRDTKITTSAQAAPRTWKGSMIDEFTVGTEWKEYTWSGEIGVDDFQSIAFDLSNGDQRNADDNGWLPGNGGNAFYFDNIEFGYDLGGNNPMSSLACTYGADVIRIDLADNTNMKDLVKAAGGKTLIYDNSTASVTWNGKECNIISVEGRPDGNLYIFLLDMDGEGGLDFDDEEAQVVVGFTNPTDAAYQLTFANGKWAGQELPAFSGIVCGFDFSLSEGEYFSYLWGGPELEAAVPEAGSFNLPADTKEFKIVFNQSVEAESIVAKLEKENLTVTPAEGLAKEVTLTRTGSGDLDGVYELVISSATGEKGTPLEENIVIKYSFGLTSTEGDDQPVTIYASNFTQEGEQANGEGWIVSADGGGMQPANSGAGSRLMHDRTGYAADVLYLAQRGTAFGVALFGTEEGFKLSLDNKKYHLSLDAAQWDAYENKRSLRVQLLPEEAVNAEDGTLIDESAIIAEDWKQIEPEFNNSKEATHFDIPVTIPVEGNYVIRLLPGNQNGTPGGYGDGCAIANIKVEYIPDVMGLVEMKALAEALEKAKATLETNSDERYNGDVFTALDNTIKAYDGKIMTAPSAYTKAVEELNAAAKAMNDHRNLCDTYDPLPQKAQDLIDQHAGSKFATTDIYKNLETAVAKYATIQNVEVFDEETGETYTKAVAVIKELKDDAELTAAVDELNSVVNVATYFFTEGESRNSSDVGVKVLVDRIRQGVEGLLQLGVAEDDALVVAGNNALTDDDDLAEQLKNRLKLEYYNKMKNGENLFPEIVDEATLETTTPTYNFTVFVKNPNTYAWKEADGLTTENCPGWTLLEGTAGLTNMWNGSYPGDIDGLPKDLTITQYHAANRIEQTVTDLPAGIYTVMIDAAEWSDEFTVGENDDPETAANKETLHEQNRVYVKTSATPAFVEGQEEPEQFAADARIDHHGQYVGKFENYLNDVVVTDGQLTLGVKWNNAAQFMFDRVKILLAAPAEGFNYAAAYEEVLAGIDVTEVQPVKVRNIAIYDLNGRQVLKAQKGINIVKKMMSDGTIRTEKVVVK